MDRLQLTEWEFRFAGAPDWRPIAVPSCWEDAGFPKSHAGPGWYRSAPVVPPEFAGRRVFLRFGAVSYHCDLYVGGRLRGQHTGAWDPFEVEVTQDATPGAPLDLLLRVEKPASLKAGPASPPIVGAYPLKTTLSGFLPYVWGHMFGGLWQPVELVAAGPLLFEEAAARGTPAGQVEVVAQLSGPGRVTLDLLGPDGELLFSATAHPEPTAQAFEEIIASPSAAAAASAPTLPNAERSDTALTAPHPAAAPARSHNFLVRFDAQVPAPQPWSPDAPALYTAVLRADGDERVIRFGLRSLRAEGVTLLLNERPVYPRMILSWGWYAERLSPDPGPERVRQDFARLKAMGYNGVKLCLWFPPPYYFELADELGMLLWVELPMWLPDPDERFRRQTPLEYQRLVRLAGSHPSVVLYSLGCELNRAVGPEILGPLYAMVKRLGGGGLVRDNSGSGEAYGGLLTEFADYYDYHFYCDLQFFRNLVDYFSPRWRPPQPWIFGEFCDYDTFRVPPHPLPGEGERERATAWWASADPAINPQGARWQMDVPHQEQRLRANGYLGRGAELQSLSELHGLLHRKVTLELVRTYREIAGYVITGEVDTPISTAGMWDESGRLKFDAESFRAFNQDTVLTLGWDKRRDWVRGGDRAAYWDSFSYAGGALVRPHVIVSHYGAARGAAALTWSIALDGEPPFASGEIRTDFVLGPGDVRELVVAEFVAPDLAAPLQAVLRVSAQIGAERTSNQWPLWFFPKNAWAGIGGVALHDPSGLLDGLARHAPGVSATDDREIAAGVSVAGSAEDEPAAAAKLVIATAWTPALDAFVRGGGRAILLQDAGGPPGPIEALPMPFWREALRLCEPHPAWGDFPHQGWAALQFYGCAPDHALDTESLGAQVRPILRRIDTRTMHYHDYAAEITWGAGRLIVSTLRFQGGNGDQPSGIARNTAAAYLLACWVRELATML